MSARLIVLLSAALLTAACGSGDKHLPSSNPPEYDPKKVYSSTSSPPTQPTPQLAKPEPRATPPPPPMDPDALRQALETADRTRAILEKTASLDSKRQIHTILEMLMMGEQAPAELRPAFRESFDARKAQIHQAFDKQYERLQQALDGESKLPAVHPPVRKSDGSEPFSLYRVNTTARPPWIHLLQGHGGITVSLEPDCCGAWRIATIPSSAFDGDGFNVEIKSGGRYWPDNDHVGEGDAITTTTKVVAGDKGSIKVKIVKKNRGVVRRCPSASGIVPGAASIYEEMGYHVATPATNRSAGIFVHDQAKTEAQTDQEGLVQEIKMDITAADLDGETGQVLRQTSGTAVKKRGSPVSCSVCDQRTTEAAKRLGDLISWNYYQAEQKWNNPPTKADACVRIHFTPATKTVTVAPGKSRKVKAELRTVTGEERTEGRLFEVQGLRDGKATPTEAKTTPEEPAVFTFTAPQKKCSKSDAPGFRVSNSSSRAGRAGLEEWEITCEYVLKFKSHIVQEPWNFMNPVFGMQMSSNGFDAHVEATVPLQYTEDRGWVGEGEMQYNTRTTTQQAQCEIRVQGAGKTTFQVKEGSISSDPEPFAVNLTILPGRSGETTETICTSANTPRKLKELLELQGSQVGDAHSVGKAGGWSSAFSFTRYKTFNRTKGGYEIGGWTPGQDSDVIAKKTVRVNCSIGIQTCQEETELTLKSTNASE
jgi:hypothetical protein